ncbi:MAG: hypothetical protein U0325_20660 [Polyangiales bacterium]
MRALVAGVLALNCATSQRPALQGDRAIEGELTLRLDADERPDHVLAVASRRLAAAGITRADVTAVTGSLRVRLPHRDLDRARTLLLATPWLRGRALDVGVDLGPLAATPPAGVRVEHQPVELMPGFTVDDLAVFSAREDTLRAHLASFPALAAAVTVVRTGAGEWRALAFAREVVLRGDEVTCAPGSTDRAVTLARSDAARASRARRWAVELNGDVVGLSRDLTRAEVVLPSPEAAAALLRDCAHGLLAAPMTPEVQSPSQGTGSSVAP